MCVSVCVCLSLISQIFSLFYFVCMRLLIADSDSDSGSVALNAAVDSLLY